MNEQKLITKIYEKSLSYSTDVFKNVLSRFSFEVQNKPRVHKTKIPFNRRWPDGFRGALINSADLELAWGWRYSKKKENPLTMANRARRNFPFLIKMFEDYQVPITWATVGHLLLRSCDKDSHKWMRRIPYFENKKWIYMSGDWFDADPHTNWGSATAWYAPDLLEMILNSRISHEIGCHTFSHIDFSYVNCPSEVADDEIKACVEVASKWGIKLKSFVFAAGTYGNYEVLRKYNFTNYRRQMKCELSYPFLDNYGFVVLPSSSGLGDNRFGWSKDYFVKRFKKFIDRAIFSGTACHFWFHPSIDEWFLHEVLPCILKYASEKREKNLLWIATMGNVAEYVATRYRLE